MGNKQTSNWGGGEYLYKNINKHVATCCGGHLGEYGHFIVVYSVKHADHIVVDKNFIDKE